MAWTRNAADWISPEMLLKGYAMKKTESKYYHPVPAIRRYRRAALTEFALILVLCVMAAVIIIRLMEPGYEIREERLMEPQVVHIITMEPEVTPMVWVKYPVPLSDEIQQYIEKLCSGTDIPPAVVMALIMVESGGDAWAISSDGRDFGLMQIRESYHRERMGRLGVTQLLDPFENVTVGIDLLDELSRDYGNPIEWTLMAYNGGIGYANEMMATGQVSQYVQQIILLSECYLESVQVMA